MVELKNRISAFTKLGEILMMLESDEKYPGGKNSVIERQALELDHLAKDVIHYNGWFTREMVRYMLISIGKSLQKRSIEKWLKPYSGLLEKSRPARTAGVVMAGNIPAVGFHDFLTVLMSGNKIRAKLSSEDNKLIPAISDLLVRLEPGFSDMISFVNGKLDGFDAVIATGSNNTSRYFDYYFGKFPHVIRKNRNGVTVLDGTETEEELNGLADDIFLFYGLGCRNVSKLFVPERYDFERLMNTLVTRNRIAENHKYFNNYEYNKAIYLINGTEHMDSGNLLLVESDQIASPVSVVYYTTYSSVADVRQFINTRQENIQCVVSHHSELDDVVAFGQSQQPRLWNYADNVDTMKFLLGLR